MTSAPVRVTFSLSPSDYRWAARALYEHAHRTQRQRVVSLLAVLIVASAGGAVIWLTVHPPLWYVLVSVVLIAVLSHVTGAMGRRVQWSLESRRMKAQPDSDRSVTYEIASDGLRAEFPQSQTLLKWPTFREIIETRDFFLFVCSPAFGYYIPKWAFNDVEEVVRARSILKAVRPEYRQLLNNAAA